MKKLLFAVIGFVMIGCTNPSMEEGLADLTAQLAQLEAEGNDPASSGRSYGTPHDLASLYGQGRIESDPGNVPDGYDEKKPLGRPEEKVSNINTQQNVFGKDRLGKKEMKVDDQPGLRENARLAYSKNSSLLESLGKRTESLLDERNIKE